MREYATFISQVGFIHPGQIKLIFDNPDTLENLSSDLKAVVLAGKAKIHSLEGNFYETSRLLEDALKVALNDYQQSRPGASGMRAAMELRVLKRKWGRMRAARAERRASAARARALASATSRFRSSSSFWLRLPLMAS